MEKWDAYDKDLNIIGGLTLLRGNVIPDGVFHLVCDIAVKHADGTYLLMQRDIKKHFGGMWELTAGGSALKGEDPLTCAKRELLEETGIISANLQQIGKVVCDENHSIYIEFLCVVDVKKDCIVLQEGETQDYRWVTKEEVSAMDKEHLVTKRMQLFLEDLKR